MFSWINHFENEFVTNKNPNDKIIIMEKSGSSKMNHSNFSGKKTCKIPNFKSRINSNKLIKNNSDIIRNKSNCKILDLSPEEKEKLANLIKELGQLQSEKEQLSDKLLDERNEYKLKIQNVEEMYNSALIEKYKLQNDLRVKEERLAELESKSRFEDPIEKSASLNKYDEFSVNSKEDFHKRESLKNDNVSQCFFPGPPKSSRSQEIKQKLLKNHNSNMDLQTNCESQDKLKKEHERLLVEKQYLSLLLKHQKYLEHLRKKVKKLEKQDICDNSPIYLKSKMVDDYLSAQLSSTNLIFPKVINEISDDTSIVINELPDDTSIVNIPVPLPCKSLSKCDSQSVSMQSKHQFNMGDHRIIRLQDSLDKVDEIKKFDLETSLRSESMLLKDDELMIISALNNKKLKPTGRKIMSSSDFYEKSLASVRSFHSSSKDSLLEMIHNSDDVGSEKCDYHSNIENSSPKNLSDKEIFEDLFFNRLCY